MCGIAGYVHINKQKHIEKNLLHNMLGSIQHRGPDGQGIWISPDQTVGLAHCRLSIVDTSAAGAQPMADAHQNIIISFNGEIYNHHQLRKELETLGYHYRSQCDTETILYAYQAWGIGCLERLEGMFAFALYDTQRDEIFLVRDRCGIKPLYFSLMNDTISFASEIKALWQLPWNVKKSNARGIWHYLTYLATPAPMTIYENIYKLPPGHYAKIATDRSITFTQWYNLIEKISLKNIQENECIEQLTQVLQESVKKRLIADVPMGIFLSGGLDSSLMTALVAQHQQPKTFTIAWEHDTAHDYSYAQRVAEHFNTDHHTLIINEQHAFDFFKQMMHFQDEPLGDPVCIPLYYLSRLLQQNGMKIGLVGEGADELFAGYSNYRQLMYHQKFFYALQKLPHLFKKGLCTISLPFFNNVYKKDVIMRWQQGHHLFYSSALVFPEIIKKDFCSLQEPAVDDIVAHSFPEVYRFHDSYSIFDQFHKQIRKKNTDFLQTISLLELQHRLPELLLMRVDKMTMATGIEARVPFLDHALVEFALSLPQELKYKQGQSKYILKKVAESWLPHEIIYRKKVGFNAPTAEWFLQGNYFKSYFFDTLQNANNHCFDKQILEKNYTEKKFTPPQLWALLNILAHETS